ncbi:MAG TPA: DNA-directed RNA polymerase subunit omega [Salinivirgaceae bacterium]|nr:DNA-directed RNA polymerase subunit omega [Salinivirgaceae bacterium]
MDFKKVTAASNTQTRDLEIFEQKAGSTYAAINILAKRADQIAIEMKEELNRTLEQFGNQQDNLEEIFENREQIEVSRFYERLPKPTAIAIKEFEEDKIYFRKAEKIEEQ